MRFRNLLAKMRFLVFNSIAMKKLLIRIVIALLVIVVIAVLGVHFFLDSAIKKTVETVGPRIAKVDVKLDSVSLSLLTGSGGIKGLVVGNPEGYKTPSAISVGNVSVAVSIGSLLSDKIVVRSIRIESPQITYELGPGGNNLKRIQANAAESSGGSTTQSTPTEGKPSKKLQVDDVVITGGKVTLDIAALGGQAVTAPLPEIHFTGLGQGPDGITAGDLAKRILSEITESSIKAAAEAAARVATEIGKDAEGAAKGAVEKAGGTVKGIPDLFKKKQ